jgi:hypothetical protein
MSRLGKHPPCLQLKPKALIRNEIAQFLDHLPGFVHFPSVF